MCGAHATVDHIAATKHIEKPDEATDWMKMRGYGEVLDWIEKNTQEVIHVADSSPKKKPKATSEASTSDDDDPTRGTEKITTRSCPWLPFADWPFALLEVGLSTKKNNHWGPMDPDMAEAIRREALRGITQFEISVMIKNVEWKYKMDFVAWTQENVATGKARKFRFARP